MYETRKFEPMSVMSPRHVIWSHGGCIFFGMLCLAVIAGCDGGGRAHAPISGAVTLDGKPLAKGSIVFQPMAGADGLAAGRGSSAYCDDDGHYELKSVEGTFGAVVGSHRVRIYGPKLQRSSADDSGGTRGQMAEIVPQKYNLRTELTFDVPGGGTDQANFDLTTK